MAYANKLNTEKPKLLITGASGMLGHFLCRLAVAQWSVFGVYRRHKPGLQGITPVQADLTDEGLIRELVSDIRPHAVIHAAANSRVMDCEARPRETTPINADVPVRLAEHCADLDIFYLFTSTDLVFDGRLAPYDEQSAVKPVCVYGEQKARAEEAVLRAYPKALVCRMPLMFGLAPHASNFTMRMLSAIQQRQTLNLLTDEFRTPVDNQSAAQGILTVLGRTRGLLHLGGRLQISRYDLGILMAEHLQIDPVMIQPTTIDALSLPVARAPDCTLDSRRAYDLGYDPAGLSTAMQRVVDRFNAIMDSPTEESISS